MMYNRTNIVWKKNLKKIYDDYDYLVRPRDMEVREIMAHQYKVPMPAYIDLIDRNVNIKFMFAEAAWIISGSNHLSDLTPYMKSYANFSDDGIFLGGAYGPKVVDQLTYVINTLENDQDTRQAVINIWRERPGSAKDIPCTLSMQFFIRQNKINMVTTMRSHDIVLGFTYDVFTFSMVANAVRLLLKERGLEFDLGDLYVTAGSMHVYEQHYKNIDSWTTAIEKDYTIGERVDNVMKSNTYHELIHNLRIESNR